MPRLGSDTAALVADLTHRLEALVTAATQEGRARALEEVRSLVGGDVRRGPGRPKGSRNKTKAASAGKPRKNSWAGLSPAARLARINAIRTGKGLPARSSL